MWRNKKFLTGLIIAVVVLVSIYVVVNDQKQERRRVFAKNAVLLLQQYKMATLPKQKLAIIAQATKLAKQSGLIPTIRLEKNTSQAESALSGSTCSSLERAMQGLMSAIEFEVSVDIEAGDVGFEPDRNSSEWQAIEHLYQLFLDGGCWRYYEL